MLLDISSLDLSEGEPRRSQCFRALDEDVVKPFFFVGFETQRKYQVSADNCFSCKWNRESGNARCELVVGTCRTSLLCSCYCSMHTHICNAHMQRIYAMHICNTCAHWRILRILQFQGVWLGRNWPVNLALRVCTLTAVLAASASCPGVVVCPLCWVVFSWHTYNLIPLVNG